MRGNVSGMVSVTPWISGAGAGATRAAMVVVVVAAAVVVVAGTVVVVVVATGITLVPAAVVDVVAH